MFAGILPKTVISHTYTEAKQTIDSFTFGSDFLIVLALLLFAVAARIILSNVMIHYKRKPALIIMYSAEAVLLIAAAIVIKFAFKDSNGLLGEISSVLNGTVSPMAGSHRVAIWQYTLKMFEGSPWFGVGVGSFKNAFSASVLTEYQQVIGKNTLPDAAHNEYLQQLATVGIIGFIAYMGWLLSIFIRGFKYSLKNPKIAVCLCAAISFAAQMFFSINLILTVPFFYVILGITEYEIRNTKQPDNSDGRQSKKSTSSPNTVIEENITV